MNNLTFARFITKYLGWDVSSFLRSRGKNDSSTIYHFKMAGNVDPSRIPTYPRFVLYDLSIEGMGKPSNQLIFDSSDFLVINTAFGSIKPGNGKTLVIGDNLKFRDVDYLILNIEITVADFFNDYSLNEFEFSIPEEALPSFYPIGRHTRMHQGKDVPYNIYIKIDLRKIES